MESAVLVLLALKIGLASSMSVMFGWQPMPDGSPKIEYLVQIEPELAATLQAGQSIPITSDIPDGIGPIGRIRIVVGRDELPRQKLVTQFKPWPGKQLPEGLVETQHTVPPVQSSGSGRYDNLPATNNAILPPSGNGPAATNPFGRALQQGAQQAKNLASELKQEILPPSGDQLFGPSRLSGQGVQNAIGNTTNQLRQGLQRDVQQSVQQVADRADQKLRQAADSVGRGARDAVDRFGTTTSPQRSILNDGHDHAGHDHAAHGQPQTSATILPPNSPATRQTDSGRITAKGRRIDQPGQRIQPPQRQQQQQFAPPANFAASPRPGQNPRSQPGVFDARWPQTRNNPPAETYTGNPPPRRYDLSSPQLPPASTNDWPSETRGRDLIDVANRSTDNPPPRYAENPQPEFKRTNGYLDGPDFPGTESQKISTQNRDSDWHSRSTPPEIRKHMVDSPDSQSENYPYRNDASYDDQNSTPKSDTLFPLLLSWVLLSGSGAGNAYLWWSYLDVRNKYRGMVHGSPRRRDRYED